MIPAAATKDVPSIVRIRLATLTEEEIRGFSAPGFVTFSSTEELRKVWSRENRLKDGFEVSVAEDEGKMVGLIVFKMESDHFYIDNIVAAKDEERKEIGRAIVSHIEGNAKSKGCYLMKTDTTENVDGVPWKSYTFWKRMGYEDTKERLLTNYDFKEIP